MVAGTRARISLREGLMNAGMLVAAGALAAGIVGGAMAMRPAPPVEDGVARAAIAAVDARMAALEADLAREKAERAAAERQIADAMNAALEAKGALDRLRAQVDDVVASLSTGA